MGRKKRTAVLLTFLICFIGLFGCESKEINGITVEAAEAAEALDGDLQLHYLDVGQGNAVLAKSKEKYMLIDGGARKSSSFVVSYLEKQGVRELEYVLISHFDEDHLAGAIGALHKFSVKNLITPDYEADSSIYRSYEEVVEEKNYQPIHPKIGDEFVFGDASFRVIAPVSYGHEDENQDSVGIIMEHGENSFFIGGDIGLESEKEILEAGVNLQSDVMMMNHHGSHVSKGFFKEVDPQIAVISCGKGNSYGHPRKDTVNLLKDEHVPLYRTDLQGTIDVSSDRKEISFIQKPCNDYTPGDRKISSDKDEPAQNMGNAQAFDCNYILNAHTKKIHLLDCSSVKQMDEDNKEYYKGDKQTLLDQGYTTCGNCRP